jgi:formylglycine-generating enzyme required for sulfatase activity
MLPSGTLLNNHYRVKRELGRGGMGAVYEAIDERLASPVALKQNLSHNTITVNAFAREARLLRKIKHDAFPRVSDYFAETDGGQYMVMELIAGPDLERELAARQSPFAVDEVARWADRLLDALEVLHNPQDPVIHRDIKPANLKLDEKGQIKLLDFGIAKGAAGDKPQAGDSRSMNFVTLAYAPVEQILRCSGDVYLVLFANHAAKVEAAAAQGTDGRSDLFALGATLYHFLTGVAPTPASARAAAVWAGQKDPLIAPHKLNPDAPPELSAMVCRALALERQDRYADAAAMRQALRDWREAKQREAAAAERRRIEEERQRLQAEAEAQRLAAETAQRQAEAARRENEALAARLREAEAERRKLQAETEQARQQLAAAQAQEALSRLPTLPRPAPPVTEELPPELRPTATPTPFSGVSLNSYSFEAVKLDKSGNVVERPKGQAQSYEEDLGGGVLLEMTLVPGGEFMMGSPDSEQSHQSDESPRHRVAVPEFYLGRYEVTQEQWRAVAKLPKIRVDLPAEPFSFKGDGRLPVESISWFEAVEFCARLKKKTGRDYRLPSEAEWEYAARAGAETPFAFGETITPYYVNYDGNYPYIGDKKELYRQKTVPVDLSDATFAGIPNAFGLYQMHGNVWEWCLDEYKETYNGAPSDGRAVGQTKDVLLDDEKARVLRGGSWGYYAWDCRSALRNRITPRYRDFNLGFRVAVASSK